MNLNTIQWRSLKTRVTLFTLIVFVTGIGATVFYVSRLLREDMQRQLGEQQLSMVSLLAAQVNDELADRLKALEAVAAAIGPAVLGDAADLQLRLEDRTVLQLLFNSGTFITRVDGTAIVAVPISTGRVGINYLDRDYMAAALKEGKTTIGRPIIGRAAQVPSFAMAAPIRDQQGRVIGAIVGATDLSQPNFLDRIAENSYGRTGSYHVVTRRERMIVTSSDKSRVMQTLPLPGVSAEIDRAMQGGVASGVYVNPFGVEVLGSGKGVPVANWYVGIILPTEEAFAPVRAMQQRMLSAAILLSLVACGLIWWLMLQLLRRQLSPMIVAAKELDALAGENRLPQPLPVTSQDEIGELIGGFNRMIEVLRSREEALKEQEGRFRSLFERASDGIVILSLGGKLIAVNESFARMHGYTAREMQTLSLEDLDTPATFQLVPERMQRVRSGESMTFEVEHRHKDGHIFPLEVSSSLIVFHGESLIQSFYRDITERKRAEETRRAIEERHRTILQTAMDGFLLIDTQGRLLEVNERYCGMSGFSARELLDMRVADLEAAETPDETAAHLQQVTAQGEGRFESRHRRKDGSVFDVEISVQYQPVEGGQFVVFLHDISERKRAEQALRGTLAEKDVLMREIHHRVKNNLQMISALLELQSGYVKDEQVLAYFKDSQQRIQSIALVHAQLYHDKNLAEIDFAAYLQNLVDNLSAQYIERREQVAIRVIAQACTLPVDIAIPCGLVVTELVTNAMKHAFPGGWTGELRVSLQAGDSGTIVLEVADDGVGMAAEPDLESGKGFGMRVVKLMVEEQLHGKLRIESGHGTRVVCEIGVPK